MTTGSNLYVRIIVFSKDSISDNLNALSNYYVYMYERNKQR